jgi:Sulfotransferase domain
VITGTRLAVWSGPRNISTALMRSWENRPDCRVVDEPLYAYYLVQSGIDHPGRDEIIRAGDSKWETVVAELTAPTDGIFYQKHMAHHLVGPIGRDWIRCLTNILLIRDPAETVGSYVKVRESVDDSDIGLIQQMELYKLLGGEVPVIDAADFLRDPEGYLRWMCDHVSAEFEERMLRWRAGPRDSDGVWARYWYGAVQSSTGFEQYSAKRIELDRAARELVDRSRHHYELLYSARVKVS